MRGSRHQLLRLGLEAATVLLVWSACREPAGSGPFVVTTNRFILHSDPWINLHHFLYQWARADEEIGTGRRRVPVPERTSLAGLPAAQQDAWFDAVRFYRDSVARRSHFAGPMLELKARLLDLNGDSGGVPADVIPGIANALTRAMPVYEARWWRMHDDQNRAWIEQVIPLLRRHEESFVATTNRVYDAAWPEDPWRVDVAAYANPRAGYTARGHIMIYSSDPGNQELYALETVLHEVQHTRAVGAGGRQLLGRVFGAGGVAVPENLWHSLIFGTAGAFVQGVAEAEGLPVHTPYWLREGFDGFAGWGTLVPAVQAHWVPVVREKTERDAALAALRGVAGVR